MKAGKWLFDTSSRHVHPNVMWIALWLTTDSRPSVFILFFCIILLLTLSMVCCSKALFWSATMAFQYFLKICGIAGSSTNARHLNELVAIGAVMAPQRHFSLRRLPRH